MEDWSKRPLQSESLANKNTWKGTGKQNTPLKTKSLLWKKWRLRNYFPFGKAYFQGQAVSFRECKGWLTIPVVVFSYCNLKPTRSEIEESVHLIRGVENDFSNIQDAKWPFSWTKKIKHQIPCVLTVTDTFSLWKTMANSSECWMRHSLCEVGKLSEFRSLKKALVPTGKTERGRWRIFS